MGDPENYTFPDINLDRLLADHSDYLASPQLLGSALPRPKNIAPGVLDRQDELLRHGINRTPCRVVISYHFSGDRPSVWMATPPVNAPW